VCILACIPAAGCKKPSGGGDSAAPAKTPKTRYDETRLATQLGAAGIRAAWAKQTKLSAIFIQMYDAKDAAGQKAMQTDLDRVYFVDNPILEQDFAAAIAEQPNEPANYVSRGWYKLPRHDTYEDGLKDIEQGITMEEPNPAWHFLLAYAYVAPLRSGDFTRFGSMDKLRWERYKDKYDIVLSRSMEKWPENWYMPYFAATHQFAIDQDLKKCYELVAKGNQGSLGRFIFVPPMPLTIENWAAVPDRDDYFDLQWNFGFYAYNTTQDMVMFMLKDKQIAADPEKLWNLMLFMYNASMTRPLDRDFHYTLGRVLLALQASAKAKGDTAATAKLAEAQKFYDGVTHTFKTYFTDSGLKMSSPDVKGEDSMLTIERSTRRQREILEPVLKLELRLMKQVRDAMGYSASKYPLYNLDGGKE
jgi:hypothetical protein